MGDGMKWACGSMAYKFDSDWAGEIASVTESPEFQTAQITITDDSLLTGGEWDPDTNTYSPTQGDSVVYSGRARVVPINAGIFTGGESQANATTITAIRVQIPFDKSDPDINLGYGWTGFGTSAYGDPPSASGRVKRSSKVYVDAAPKNPALVGRLFNVTSDLQGSSAASRTFRCAADEDAVVPLG